MKAVVYTEYGSPDVLQVKEVAKPTPKDNEVLIKVHANSVNFGDIIARKLGTVAPHGFYMPSLFWLFARMEFGFNKPKKATLGSEFGGAIEAVGKDVTRFKIGDAVFGYRGMNMGANAEYLCMPADGMIAIKPGNMSYEEAATIPGGTLTALSLLRKVDIQRGQKILINGASGGIGSAAVQLAKHFGAEVTGVCGTPRLEFVKALGADKVIDYTKDDFTQSSETYDLIFDVLGKSSFAHCKRVLKPNGRLLYASFKMKQVFQMLWTSKIGSKKVICALSSEKLDDLILIKELAEAGKIKSIIDRCYPLEQVADAHRYVENGHKMGNVVIRVAHQN
ncbi:MAG: NAD(P)-dependent alcohol dehydrogenase [Candidatus Methanoperedens sp.]|nr:NAD(P)-dependent alcohol dehydrogenase [Candidatus Methanoperedens sp.]